MAFVQLHWFSQVLRKQTTTWILLPETGTPPFPTFYLLHGLSDNHTTWLRRTRIEDHAAALPLIIVMPDGGRSYYTNHAAGPAWATHIAEELPTFIERNFPAKTTRDSRCIGGLSMGGYGAMRLSLGYPEKYISANSHSGSLMGPNPIPGTISQEEVSQIIGPSYKNSDHDLAAIAKRAATSSQFPQLLIDCGIDDFRLPDNRQFHQALLSQKIPHDYREFPGNHNWDYWEQHIPQALAFHAGALGLAKTSPS
jgi:putative tributyrin esterase